MRYSARRARGCCRRTVRRCQRHPAMSSSHKAKGCVGCHTIHATKHHRPNQWYAHHAVDAAQALWQSTEDVCALRPGYTHAPARTRTQRFIHRATSQTGVCWQSALDAVAQTAREGETHRDRETRRETKRFKKHITPPKKAAQALHPGCARIRSGLEGTKWGSRFLTRRALGRPGFRHGTLPDRRVAATPWPHSGRRMPGTRPQP